MCVHARFLFFFLLFFLFVCFDSQHRVEFKMENEMKVMWAFQAAFSSFSSSVAEI